MRYAVFDWDNTVREGYTLFSWIDYLSQKGILDSRIQICIKEMEIQYISGKITHDQYANYACQEYTKAIKGKNVSLITSELIEYMLIDEKKIFPFAKEVFKLLSEYHILSVVISGAPLFIIEKYQKNFGIEKIYAFSAQESDGFYNGEIETNFGYNKELVIEQLINKYNEKPFMGFGDSQSDIPLLKTAKYPFCIFDNEKGVRRENIVYIQNHISRKEINNIIMPYLL